LDNYLSFSDKYVYIVAYVGGGRGLLPPRHGGGKHGGTDGGGSDGGRNRTT
jgi:hypothetical protein